MFTIIQKCDRCGTTRNLTADVTSGAALSVKHAGDLGGWRELAPNKHICATCVNSVVEETVTPPEEPTPAP